MRIYFSSAPRARLVAVACAALLTVACGGDDRDGPTAPSPTPPLAGTAALTIENFTATVTPGPAGTFNYRASLRLRETGGAAATVTAVTVTLTQASGVSISREVAAAEAFPTTAIAANATLDSHTLSVNGAPIQATQLGVRIAFTGAGGNTTAVQATTNVTAG